RIQKFTNDGTFITKWGSSGTGDGQFTDPYGVAVDGNGHVFVSEYVSEPYGYSHRIQKFTDTGGFLTKWGSKGTGDGQFHFPTGVAVDVSGNVYVADEYNDRVQEFTNSGTFIRKWGCAEFHFPAGIAVDGSGNVFVGDFNNRVQKFVCP